MTRTTRFRSPASGASTRAATTRSMRTAEAQIQAGVGGGAERAAGASARNALRPLGRRGAWVGLAAVLAGALALRVWGIGQGLPYVYNIDEGTHFVPKAIEMFKAGHGLDPHYFANPPAFTYLLHLVLAVWFGGAAGVSHAASAHPTEVYVVARATAAVLGTAAVWLLYLVG